jgi:TldD protein
MRTLAPPSARGWEYLLGAGWNWNEEIDQILELLREQLQAPSAIPGCYDLVIDPSHLWLVVHESVGHALEFDRMLGHEAAFAGTSYLPADSISSFQLGSELMTVIADRTSPNGLATIGFDDEGVSAQSWLIVNSGRVVGTMVDRVTAALAGMERSNGCSAAASPFHQPVVRMPNISIAPAADPTTTTDLIAGVDRGMYVVGDSSWSIDMQRQQFRFSPQRCHLIRNGRLDGQVREMAYEGSTVPFWHSLAALGGPGTYQVFGTDRCGKAQPLQIGAVSHGCPSALFRAVAVGDTRRVNGWRT